MLRRFEIGMLAVAVVTATSAVPAANAFLPEEWLSAANSLPPIAANPVPAADHASPASPSLSETLVPAATLSLPEDTPPPANALSAADTIPVVNSPLPAGHPSPAEDTAAQAARGQFPSGQLLPGKAWKLSSERNLLYAETSVQDSLPVRVFLESGVYFPLIDSALVWAHPGLFNPVELERPVRFRMAGGTNYVAAWKLAPGLKVGGTRSLRDSYVVDLRGGKPCDVLYPLNTFTTDSVGTPGIFGLDMRSGIFRPLTPGELPASGDGWDVYGLLPDEGSGMYCVVDSVRLSDALGRSRAMPMRLVVDLGNANLLALFAFKPGIGEFVSQAPVDLVEGRTPGGMTLRVLMPAVATFMGRYPFRGQPVVVLDKPMELPGDGFLGVKFFEAFRVIFDFRHGRLWLQPAG